MRVLIPLLLLLVAPLGLPALAENLYFQEQNQQVTTVASIVGPIEVQPSSDHAFTDLVVSVVLDPAPGWHLYWRFPGDAGKAPVTTFHLPSGVTVEGPLVWPAPERFAVAELRV